MLRIACCCWHPCFSLQFYCCSYPWFCWCLCCCWHPSLLMPCSSWCLPFYCFLAVAILYMTLLSFLVSLMLLASLLLLFSLLFLMYFFANALAATGSLWSLLLLESSHLNHFYWFWWLCDGEMISRVGGIVLADSKKIFSVDFCLKIQSIFV